MRSIYLAGNAEALADTFYDVRGIEKILPGEIKTKEGLTMLGIELGYNPKKIDISGILEHYFEAVNPYEVNVDERLQAGIAYNSAEDMMQLQYYATFLQSRGHEPIASTSNLILNDSYREGEEFRPLAVRFGRLAEFIPA